jgi:predicted nucleic acid-binding Zn ribbon protein
MSAPRKRPMRRLSDVLPEVALQLGLDEELRLSRAMASWERLVQELVPAAAGASAVLEIRPPTLVVSAADAIVAQELRLRAADLLAAFATAPGGVRLLELRPVIKRRATGPPASGSGHGDGRGNG